MFDLNLDLSNVQADSFEQLMGSYSLMVTGVEIKRTKNMTGTFISCECTITKGPAEGRKVWARFNIQNDNEKAVEIGLKQLKTMTTAAGFTNDKITSPDQLLNLEFEGYLITEESEYGESVEIKKMGPLGTELKYKIRVKKEDPKKELPKPNATNNY